MKQHPSVADTRPRPRQHPTRDGPATLFAADPKVTDLFTADDGDYFGLVLVTNWPSSSVSLEDSYPQFVQHVRTCFDAIDLDADDDHDDDTNDTLPGIPAVYLYPTRHLHITVATFVPQTKDITTNTKQQKQATEDQRMELQQRIAAILQKATQLASWPTTPLQLVVDTTQLGRTAGILLWHDQSGGIERIRQCLREVWPVPSLSSSDLSHSKTLPLPPLRIPGIIHSTFLRFARTPHTPGEQIQARFQTDVIPQVGRWFHNKKSVELEAPVDTLKFVCESRPYMHVPDDARHVLWNTTLGE